MPAEQQFAQGRAGGVGHDLVEGFGVVGAPDDPPRERVTIRVQPVGGEREEAIARPEGATVDERGSAHLSDDRADEIQLSRRVHPRHLRGLSADQGAPRLQAGLAHPLDQFRDGVGRELPGSDVVEKKDRARPMHQDVVHAVGDDVVPDPSPGGARCGDLELGPDAVHRGDQQAVGARLGKGKEPGKGSDLALHARGEGTADQPADSGHGALPFFEIDAGGGIGRSRGESVAGPVVAPVGRKIGHRAASGE